MKKVVYILLVLSFFNCSSSDDALQEETPQIPEATIIGRWHLVGFETNVLYEFTDVKRYTFYSENGTFLTLEEAIAQQPNFTSTGNDWYYEDEKVTVDLNFGNFVTLTPQFICDNYVIQWLDDAGELHSTYFREGYDFSNCTEAN